MHVIQTGTGIEVDVKISKMEKSDYKNVGKRTFHFDWRAEKSYDVYKLVTAETEEILGLVSLNEIDIESRVEIRLLGASKENTGIQKKFDRVAGNLIGFAARVAIKKYGHMACISLIPKTELRNHYRDSYYFKEAGISMFVQGIDLLKLGKEYE